MTKSYTEMIREKNNLPEKWFPLSDKLVIFDAEEALEYEFVDEIIEKIAFGSLTFLPLMLTAPCATIRSASPPSATKKTRAYTNNQYRPRIATDSSKLPDFDETLSNGCAYYNPS